MKVSASVSVALVVVATTISSPVTAYLPANLVSHRNHRHQPQSTFISQSQRPQQPARQPWMLSMSDFASAMPEKPKLSLEEELVQAADNCIASLRGSLGDGVDPPPELDALQQVRDKDGATAAELSLGVYELMIERGMIYDEDPDTGKLTPTEFDIQANLDVPEVKDEFQYLYMYGMAMIKRGWVTVDDIKGIVEKRLISRTGLSPEEFDAWLGY